MATRIGVPEQVSKPAPKPVPAASEPEAPKEKKVTKRPRKTTK